MIEHINEPVGTSKLARFLKSIVRNLRAQELKPGVGYRVNQTSKGTTLQIDSFGGGVAESVRPELYRLKSVQANHLVCRAWDGEVEGAEVAIAKPYKLRESITSAVLDGATVTYTYWPGVLGEVDLNRLRRATIDNAFEMQVVVPRWLVNDFIYAARVETTGAITGSTTIELIDLNVDARAWAKKF